MRYEDWTPVEKEIIGNEVHYKLNMVQNLPPPTYINPDEVYFADANRPRDQYWFPIRPGQQMGKWDMRSSLKNTYLETWSISCNSWDTSFNALEDYVLPKQAYSKIIEWKEAMKICDIEENWKLYKESWIKISKNWSYFLSYYVNFTPSILYEISPIVFSMFKYDDKERLFHSIPWFTWNWFFYLKTWSASSISKILKLKKWDILLPRIYFPIELEDDAKYIGIANYQIDIIKLS